MSKRLLLKANSKESHRRSAVWIDTRNWRAAMGHLYTNSDEEWPEEFDRAGWRHSALSTAAGPRPAAVHIRSKASDRSYSYRRSHCNCETDDEDAARIRRQSDASPTSSPGGLSRRELRLGPRAPVPTVEATDLFMALTDTGEWARGRALSSHCLTPHKVSQSQLQKSNATRAVPLGCLPPRPSSPLPSPRRLSRRLLASTNPPPSLPDAARHRHRHRHRHSQRP